MPRLVPIETREAAGSRKAVLEAVEGRLDMVPNFLRIMANSAAAAKGYNSFNLAIRGGILPPRVRESIALLVGQFNASDYGLAAHTALAKMEGLSDEEVMDCRRGDATDSLTRAALKFTLVFLETKGHIRADDLDTLRKAGYDAEEVVEIMAIVALNQFTNYFTNAVQPDLDFPPAADLAEPSDSK